MRYMQGKKALAKGYSTGVLVYTMQPENQDGAFCPGANFSCTGGRVNFEIGRIPTYFSIASSSLSCLSSALIVAAYLSLREIRMGSQKINTLLAVYFYHALYFYLIVVKNRHRLAIRLLPWENVIAWFIPILIVLPILITGRLGYAPYAASNWCYIQDNDYKQDLKDNTITILLIFIAGKFWEIMSYFIVLLLYGITRVKFGRMQVQLFCSNGSTVVHFTLPSALLHFRTIYIHQ